MVKEKYSYNNKFEESFEDISDYFDGFSNNPKKLTDLEAKSICCIFKKKNIKTVLDCACGTGVPALGLAKFGYGVSASDISPNMIKIINKKAKTIKVKIKTKVADFCDLSAWKGNYFDAVICTGNSLPLLQNRKDIITALKSMYGVLRQNGIIVLGLHNYDIARKEGIRMQIRKIDLEKEIRFDIRNFQSKRVIINYFICLRNGKSIDTKFFSKSYMYLNPRNASKLLFLAGFKRLRQYDFRGVGPYKGGEWGFAIGSK
jgi:ubiquinone/menaquinone biosynthesis C-methylase UbiE